GGGFRHQSLQAVLKTGAAATSRTAWVITGAAGGAQTARASETIPPDPTAIDSTSPASATKAAANAGWTAAARGTMTNAGTRTAAKAAQRAGNFRSQRILDGNHLRLIVERRGYVDLLDKFEDPFRVFCIITDNQKPAAINGHQRIGN